MFEEQEESKKGPVFNVDWKPLTDECEMPGNGVHKGKKMKDVPADYLIWCFENDRCSKQVRAYVVDNMDVLKQQAAELNKNKPKKEPWEGGRIDFAPRPRSLKGRNVGR